MLDDRDRTESDISVQFKLLQHKYTAKKEELKATKQGHRETTKILKNQKKQLVRQS